MLQTSGEVDTVDIYSAYADRRRDMDMALDKIVPETLEWLHTDEGPECVHLSASVGITG
jgi:thiamine phosphate synthase YjbQ (UPF0047 family)